MSTASEILGIASSASPAEAKTAYRRLAMKLHPDRVGGNTEAFQKLHAALKTFKTISVCPLCLGKGHMRKYQGFVAWDVPCPQCWKR